MNDWIQFISFDSSCEQREQRRLVTHDMTAIIVNGTEQKRVTSGVRPSVCPSVHLHPLACARALACVLARASAVTLQRD